MSERITTNGLHISQPLYELVAREIIPALETINVTDVWGALATLIKELAPINEQLLADRQRIKQSIDAWHLSGNDANDIQKYRAFLTDIGYLEEEVNDFQITTESIDPEISTIAGPQLVVPVNNARYALNAANARWGSFYDALYGTDVIPETNGQQKENLFNPKRGKAVITRAAEFLDQAIPLENCSHTNLSKYQLTKTGQLALLDQNGKATRLVNPDQFIGHRQEHECLILLFKNHDLHIELHINPSHLIGSLHQAGVKDIVLESAITTIQDCEDSVAAVDAEDKVQVYRNWLGLMRGDLQTTFHKDDKTITRSLHSDREYTTPSGENITLPGRSLMLVRNVGHLMTTDAVLTDDDKEIPEGILDGLITSLIALYDLNGKSRFNNSRTGSVYIVKPKMHGSAEVKFAAQLFSRIEDLLNLPRNTLKLGIMDEERRTTVNLKACIHAAKERVIFINTGFLDRTGDEINTSMEAGAFLPKNEIKSQPWIAAYENQNVDIGLSCGLKGKAQIGKGMWAMPDRMAQMLSEKQTHPESGANCAWVPSPTAATLHATHYHFTNVRQKQAEIAERKQANLDHVLTIPLLQNPDSLSEKTIQNELDNNAQGILGYVVRWINQGVGCSKVPDIHDIGLMEDRATLRISSQHMTNWIHHGICSEEQVIETFKRMAQVVDKQNTKDPDYQPMSPNYDCIAFNAALDLVIKGKEQPSGYTEPLLHAYRKERKQYVRSGMKG